MRKIPPLYALRAFEAAARHLSFSRAAGELGVTATAISHQIRLLENTIGQKLFRRQPRPMALTEAGERLFPTVRDSLNSMARAVDSVTTVKQRQLLRISMTPAFASGVVLPRLSDWSRRHPDVELEIHASNLPVNLASEEADLAIRYASRPETSLVWEELCADSYRPMVSPALLADEKTTGQQESPLFDFPLIAYRWRRADPAEPSWDKWWALAKRQGYDLPPLAEGQSVRLSEESHAIEAAMAGQGAVLASTVITGFQRSQKKLVAVSDLALPGLTYFLVHAPLLRDDTRVARFGCWLASILRHAAAP
ncbi:MAG TPA: LysR family transcriptional regulator [Kiloniellaceae bacterium]|nr:LysR family transcriptional regulator [Kiloniellaceae bacterium]